MKNKAFDLIITGYGGQGILTLADIISKAALKQGYEVRESELHGLAQRGGSLNCHVRFGKGKNKIYSPLVRRSGADLIISLEALEALRACYWANKNTIILTNSKIFRSCSDLNQIIDRIKKFTKNLYTVDADSLVERITNDIMMTNVFILGYAIKKGFLPLKRKVVWETVRERVRKRFLENNKKVFDAAFE